MAESPPDVKPHKPPNLQSLGNWLDNQLARQERIGNHHETPIEELTPEEVARLPRHLRGCRTPHARLHPVNGELLNQLRRDYQEELERLQALRDKWQPMFYPTTR
ncbi:MAG: hypothetical protein ABFE07_20630 [Armatimonadia bacterium]